jgi:hypothetical protein
MNSSTSHPAASGIPHDLRLWLGEDRLLRLALAASVAVPLPRGGDFQHQGQSFPVGQMLTTLAYAYLSGRSGSDEIADQLEEDPALRYLGAGRPPGSTALRRFRRVHRGLLGALMLCIVREAVAERRQSAWLNGPHPDWMADETEVAVRSAAAAEAALARAVFADAVALDV